MAHPYSSSLRLSFFFLVGLVDFLIRSGIPDPAKNKREQDNSVDKTEENSNADTSQDSWWAQKKRNWDR